MQSNLCETDNEDVGVIIKTPKNTDKKVDKKCQTVVDSNIIILDNSKITCKVCKCQLPSIDHVLPHIGGKQHDRTLNELKQQENNLKLLENITCLKESDQTLLNHDNVLKNDIIDCKICQIRFGAMCNYLEHITGKRHKIQLAKNQSKDSKYNVHVNTVDVDELPGNIIKELKDKTELDHEEVQTSMYDCELCSERMNINDLFAHINSHRDNQSLNSTEDIILYKCVCCMSIIDGDTSLICHIKKITHSNNFRNFMKLIHATNNSKNTDENNFFAFTILLPKVDKTSAHFEEKCLIRLDRIHYSYSYSCSICREELSGTQPVIRHCEKRIHQLNIKKLFSYGKVENNSDSTMSLLNCFDELSIIDSDNKIQSSDASDTGLTMSNAVCKQIMEKIKENPLQSKNRFSVSTATTKFCKVKSKEKWILNRLNKLYHMKYFQLEEKMFTLTEKKINEIKLYFQLFIQYDKHIYCMACKQNVPSDLYLLYDHTRLLLHRMNVTREIKNNAFTGKYIKIDMPVDEKESTQESKKTAAKVVVTCQVCRVPIKDVDNIMPHIKCIVHKQNCEKNDNFIDSTIHSILKDFSDLYYSIMKFTCVECNNKIPYKIEFVEHICQCHKDILKKKNYMFDFCIPCATFWFSKSDSYEGHCKDIVHKYLLRNKDFMVEDLPKCIRKMLTQVDSMMNILLQETQRVTKDHVQEEVRKSLEMKAKLCYSQARAFLFGSRLIELGSTNCDIDIYIDSGNKYYSNKNNIEQELLHIKEAIGIDEDVWVIKETLLKCRVPIIKLIYKPRNLDCDVSFINGLSVEKSKLLRYCMCGFTLMNRINRSFNNTCLPCKKLTLFVKKWFSFINLYGGHGFSNFTLYWLVIYYLQENKHLPSVAELINENNSSEFIGDWQIGFASVKCKSNHELSVTVLLQGFFEFYANFDYQHYIICPLMGSLIAKTNFTESQKLPEAMNAYTMHLKTSSKPEFLRIDSPLCVQDPLELSQNITKGVSSITLKYFRQYCKECAAILKFKEN